jgi:sortase B
MANTSKKKKKNNNKKNYKNKKKYNDKKKNTQNTRAANTSKVVNNKIVSTKVSSSKNKYDNKENISIKESNKTVKTKMHLKQKYLLIIQTILIFICIGTFSYSVYHIFTWMLDNKKVKEIENNILNDIVIEEITEDNENDELIDESQDNDDIYWKYNDVSLINVDINALKEENSDTIGWIQVLGTNINYPIVQYSDNKFYLKHDYLKRSNSGGWIFLDYRNDLNSLQDNTIIYGHRRYNQSMFGTLKNVLTDSWLSNTDNHIIKISAENSNYLFQVFSVYSIPNETYYLQNTFDTKDDYQEFLNTITNRSIYNFNTSINSDDKILTLSTCHNDGERLVVHAKLIKSSNNK